MKRIINWFKKIDTIWIMLIIMIVVVALGTLKTDSMYQSQFSLIVVPVCYFMLQVALQKKQENHHYGLELYLMDNFNNGIIWKNPTDDTTENFSYLNIVNTGELEVFQFFLKITQHNGTVGWFELDESIRAGKECVIRVPYKRETIKEISISCSLPMESRTKKYNGFQTGDGSKYIFSKIERFDEEKYAIFHEVSFDKFVKLERFWIQ